MGDVLIGMQMISEGRMRQWRTLDVQTNRLVEILCKGDIYFRHREKRRICAYYSVRTAERKTMLHCMKYAHDEHK